MSQIGDDAESSGTSLKKAGQVGAAAIGAITTAVTGAVAGIAKLTKNATEYAQQVDTAAQQSGIAAERIQEIAYAAQQTSGANFDQVRDGLKELALRSEEAAMGTGEAAEAFDRLGISQEFIQQSSTAEIFRRVREELQGASAGLRTFAAETILGGEAGEQMVEVLGLTNEEMQKLSRQAQETGSVLSSEQVQALEKTRMAWDRIWSTLKGVGRTIAAAMLPVVKRLTPIVQRAATRLQEMFAGLDPQAVAGAMDTAIGWTRRLWNVTKTVAEAVVDIWNSFVSGLSKLWQEWGGFLIEQFSNTWKHITSLLRGVAGVLAGLWKTLIGTLTGNWSRAWNGIKQVVTSAALTIAESILAMVQSVLNTLSTLTSRIPGVGDVISGGLESAESSVASFRDRILQANKAASGFQDTWSGFSGGDFGGGGAGGLFDFSTGDDAEQPGTASVGGGGGEESSSDDTAPSGSGFFSDFEMPSLTLTSALEGASVDQISTAVETGLINSVNQADAALGSLRKSFNNATSQEQRERIQQIINRVKGLKQNFKEAGQQTTMFKQAGQQATNVIAQGFNQIASGVGQSVAHLISGKNAFKSFGQAAVRALKNVLSQLVALIPKLAIISGLKSIFGITSGGFTSIAGVLSEGIPFLDSGGTILSDGIAKVHKGETVVPEGAGMAGQNVNVTVTGEISATMDELVFALDRNLRAKGKPGLL